MALAISKFIFALPPNALLPNASPPNGPLGPNLTHHIGEFKHIIIRDLPGQKTKSFWRVLGWGRGEWHTSLDGYLMINK